MTRRILVVCIVLLAIALAGCSTLKVQHDWDEQADFTKFKTFKLLDRSDAGNQLVENRIRDAVRIHLSERGFVEDTTSPDFEIAIHGNVKDRVDVQTYNYGYPYYGGYGGYGGYGYWHGGQDVSVSHYQEGTLIIDFVDSEDHELFWRGWGTKTLDASTRDTDVIQGIVDKILDQYPPN